MFLLYFHLFPVSYDLKGTGVSCIGKVSKSLVLKYYLGTVNMISIIKLPRNS